MCRTPTENASADPDHVRRNARGRRGSGRVIVVGLAIAVPLAAVAAVLLLGFGVFLQKLNETIERQARLEQMMFRVIATMSADSVEEVTVSDDIRGQVLARLTEPQKLTTFVNALQDVEKWPSNLPRLRGRYYVVLKLDNGWPLEYIFQPGEDGRVYIHFISEKGEVLAHPDQANPWAYLNFGTVRSDALYAWMQQNGLL